MTKSNKPQSTSGPAQLSRALLSIGTDKGNVEKLVSSKDLTKMVIPIYWKDGLVVNSSPLWLIKLPEFLKSFREEFPDGQVRWDPYYDENGKTGKKGDDIALRVYFNYQEDDDGDHWSLPPDLLEEEKYHNMLAKAAFGGSKQVQAARVLHGK